MLCGSLTEITPRKDFLKISKPTVSVLVGICMKVDSDVTSCFREWMLHQLLEFGYNQNWYAQFIAIIINL